jgi:hypothetical protein
VIPEGALHAAFSRVFANLGEKMEVSIERRKKRGSKPPVPNLGANVPQG